MLLSKKWLEQYLPKGIKIKASKLRNRITYSLAEVENIYNVGEELTNIVVGEIKKIKPHPKSDNLHVAIVDIGNSRKKTIVCAAKNIFEGAKVPVALPGGSVLNPEQDLGSQDSFEIKEIEIKKIKSSGMLCSQKELGISDDHKGIWILPDELNVGEDFCGMLKDTILEIENKSLTHRSDCFSHLGIARELSAILKIPFDYEESQEILVPTQTLPLVVKVEDPKLCQRYTAIAIHGVKIQPSPLWLQLKLLAVGVKPINNVVDATNFVMLDMGQPIHAFDYNKLDAPRVIVRKAKKGEEIRTLDGDIRRLGSDQLLITDPKGPIAIAGIMGGLDTEVDNDTQDIIIESANFEMYNIRRSTNELGLRTEASTRFEKGQDPHTTLPALKRVAELITETAGGEIASEVIDIYKEPGEERQLEFDTDDVPRFLGIEVSKEEVIHIFESLHLAVNTPEVSSTKLSVTIPTFRRDLNIKEDLLEEVARIFGYDKFHPTLPVRDLKSVPKNFQREFEKMLMFTMSSLGFDEIYTYSFIGEQHYRKTLLDIDKCLKLKNPLSPELAYMRNSLVPSILEKVKLNLANFDEILIYEMSRIFFKEKNKEGLPNQPLNIIGLVSKHTDNKELYFTLKEKVIALLGQAGIATYAFEKVDSIPYFHPGQQALITTNKVVLGNIGTLHPQVKDNWNIDPNTSLFILDIEKLFELQNKEKVYKRFSKYPYVKRDLSFWVKKDTQTGHLVKELEKGNFSYVKDIEVKDIYEPKTKQDEKSITIQVILQSKRITLSEEEINIDISVLIETIKKFGGTLRKK
ncbi:phenylalanine--tRNA ligase subunit beta [Candidatus Dojkabacteria bacterium]|nr:phenylalanine--tRNA ligase subunit beta [Candidatus Dojkabacteria bacterium]